MGVGPSVVGGDAALVGELYKAPPEAFGPGKLVDVLAPIWPSGGTIFQLSDKEHLARRRLELPAFHGDRIAAWREWVTKVAQASIAGWPGDRAFASRAPLQSLTLESILTVLCGTDVAQPATLRSRTRAYLRACQTIAMRLPRLQRDLGPRSPWGRFLAARRALHAELEALIGAGSRDPNLAARDDVLATLLLARDADGRSLTHEQIR